jgi:hypothetical protein
MPHCSDEILLSYQDGELEQREEKRVKEHLQTCWSCRQRLAAIEEQVQWLAREADDYPGPTWIAKAREDLHQAIDRWESEAGHEYPPAHRRSFSILRPWRISIAGVAALLILWAAWPIPKIQAAELLRRSAATEQNLLTRARAFRQTWTIETRRGHGSVRRKLELWRSRSGSASTRRLYDDRGHLIAAEWAPAKERIVRCENGLCSNLTEAAAPNLQAGSMWRINPSAGTLLDLMEGGENARVDLKGNMWLVNYERAPGAAAPSNGLIRAWALLDRSDLRLMEASLLFADPAGEWEWRSHELEHETYLDREPPAAAFVPAPFFPMSPAQAAVRAMVSRMPAIGTSHDPGGPARIAPVDPGTEVRIIERLAFANLTLGERAELSRVAGGVLHLAAIVEKEGQRDRVMKTLAPFVESGLLTVDMQVEPAPQKALPASFSPEATELLEHCDRARTHATAAKRLAEHFTPSELDAISEDERQQFIKVIFRHILGAQQELMEAATSRDSGGSGAAIDPASQFKGVPLTTATLATGVRGLLSCVDGAVQKAYTAVLRLSGGSWIEDPDVQQSLRRCANESASIVRAMEE